MKKLLIVGAGHVGTLSQAIMDLNEDIKVVICENDAIPFRKPVDLGVELALCPKLNDPFEYTSGKEDRRRARKAKRKKTKNKRLG